MPFTPGRFNNLFHVSYRPAFSTQQIGLPLMTETSLNILTESSEIIYAESAVGVVTLKAHRVGLSEFRVTGIGST